MHRQKFTIVITLFSLFYSCSISSPIDYIHSISELDHYIVQNDNMYGVINESGTVVIPFDTIRMIDYSGDKIEYFQNNQYYLKDALTGIKTEKYDWLAFDDKSQLYYVEKNNKVGYLNKYGDVIIPLIYERTNSIPEYSKDGYIRVNKGGKYGIIKIDGTEIIPPNYHNITYKGNDLFTCRPTVEGHTGLINSNNEIILPFDYTFGVGDFSEGKLLAYNFQINDWGAIDTNGLMVIDFKYDYGTKFNYGVLPISKNSKWGLINEKNQIVVEPIHSKIEAGIKGIEGLFSCSLDNKWGVINSRDEEIIPFIYKNCFLYYGQIMVTNMNEKLGVFDMNGKEILPCLYDNISFSENIFKVVKGDVCFYFNKNGKQLTEQSYSTSSRAMYDNYALVMRNGKYGFIDTLGNEYIKCQFDYLAAITNNPRKFVMGRKGKFFVADVNGIHKLKY